MVNFVKQHWATILVILILLWKIIPFIWQWEIVKILLIWFFLTGLMVLFAYCLYKLFTF